MASSWRLSGSHSILSMTDAGASFATLSSSGTHQKSVMLTSMRTLRNATQIQRGLPARMLTAGRVPSSQCQVSIQQAMMLEMTAMPLAMGMPQRIMTTAPVGCRTHKDLQRKTPTVRPLGQQHWCIRVTQTNTLCHKVWKP